MTPQQRLAKALELSVMTKDLFREGLRRRYRGMSEAQLRAKAIEHLYPWRK